MFVKCFSYMILCMIRHILFHDYFVFISKTIVSTYCHLRIKQQRLNWVNFCPGTVMAEYCVVNGYIEHCSFGCCESHIYRSSCCSATWYTVGICLTAVIFIAFVIVVFYQCPEHIDPRPLPQAQYQLCIEFKTRFIIVL